MEINTKLKNELIQHGIQNTTVSAYGEFVLEDESIEFINKANITFISPVVYGFLVRETNEIIYIGYSSNVDDRMRRYKQGINRTTYHTDVKKSTVIKQTLCKGHTLDVFVYSIKNYGHGKINTINKSIANITRDLERLLIGAYKPLLNKHNIGTTNEKIIQRYTKRS